MNFDLDLQKLVMQFVSHVMNKELQAVLLNTHWKL
jgi:hypothetical protein